MWGRGVTHGTQTQGGFLPVPHTDFIFSAFAEEHGFVVVVVVLGLYFLLLMQIVQNAQMAPDRAGMYICMGVATMLLFHVLVNVGMVVGQYAGDGDSLAADELRRLESVFDIYDAGAGEQCPAPAVFELSFWDLSAQPGCLWAVALRAIRF